MTSAVVLAILTVLAAIAVFIVLGRIARPMRDGFTAVAVIFTVAALVAAVMQGWLASERSSLIDLGKTVPDSMDHTWVFAALSAVALIGLLATGFRAMTNRSAT